MKQYPKYIDSGVDWIGEIPEHWTIGRLKYYNDIIMGQSPNSEDYSVDPVSLPFLQGNAEFGELYPIPSIYCDSANKTSDENDILISVRAPVGAVNISDQVYGIGRGLAAVRKPENFKFNFFYLQMAKSYLYSLSTGSTFTAISVDDLKNLPYPKISSKEQIAIANFLDHKTRQINDLIAKKERLIELLKEERTAVINQAVTKGLDTNVPMKDSGIEWLGEIPEHWEVKRLKFLATTVQTGSTPPTGNSEYYDESDYDWYTPVDFTNGIYLTESNRKLNYFAIESGIAKEFNPFTVLIVGIGATLGKVGIIRKPSSSNQQINAIVFKENQNPIYHAYYLQCIESIIKRMSNAATLAILNQNNTKNLLMVCPPKEEQDLIAERIDNLYQETDSRIDNILKQISYLTEYKTSLINEAVTGKIDVRDYHINHVTN